MRITLCGSLTFNEQMLEVKHQLEELQESLEEDMLVLRPSVLNGNVTMMNTLLIAG